MDKNEILDLLIKKHYGLIAEPEDALLERILASNSEARAMQQEIQDHPRDKAMVHLNKMDLADAALQINVKYQALLAHKNSL